MVRRHSLRSMGTVWVPCCRGKEGDCVEALGTRPLQCYRCMEFVHVRQDCTCGVDRTGRCSTCGAEGHRDSDCKARPRCPLCADAGLRSNHRLGSKFCNPPRTRRRTAPATAATSSSLTITAPGTDAQEDRAAAEQSPAATSDPSSAREGESFNTPSTSAGGPEEAMDME